MRRIVRRIGGKLVSVFWLRVRFVEILETRPEAKAARVRYKLRVRDTCYDPATHRTVNGGRRTLIVTTWTTFDRLASTRAIFRERYLAAALVTGNRLGTATRERRPLLMPATTAPRS